MTRDLGLRHFFEFLTTETWVFNAYMETRAIDSKVWTDHDGRQRKTPTRNYPLKFSKCQLHADLRAFVFRRDGFRCVACGTKPQVVPEAYTGVRTVGCDPGLCLVMDHIISIRRGGTHHPLNLQTMCDSCNARKSVLVEGHGR